MSRLKTKTSGCATVRWIGYLGGGGEPSELEPWGGAGGGVAEEEGGLGEVELGGDGLQPPLVGGLGGVLEEADRGRVALERLCREGVHLRRPHRRQRHVMPRANREKAASRECRAELY